jgi:hypothetical protein
MELRENSFTAALRCASRTSAWHAPPISQEEFHNRRRAHGHFEVELQVAQLELTGQKPMQMLDYIVKNKALFVSQ